MQASSFSPLDVFDKSTLLFSIAALASSAFLFYVNSSRTEKKNPKSDNELTSQHDYVQEIEIPSPEAFDKVVVSKILIHPIKSCKGTSVESAAYTPEGLENDRTFAIVDASSHKVITAREQPKMILIHPQVVSDPEDECGGKLIIVFPEDSGCQTLVVPLKVSENTVRNWDRLGDIKLWASTDIDSYICQDLNSPERDFPTKVMSRFFDRAVHLVCKGPRPRACPPTTDFPELQATTCYQDGYPLLVASEESLEAVQERVRGEVGKQGVADRWKEDELVMERFRPNIVFKGTGMAWAEDLWERIRIGANESTICLVAKCPRCLLPNIDPETGVRDMAVPFKVLMKFRRGIDPTQKNNAFFGCNGVPSGDGYVRVGESVAVVKMLSQ